MTSRIHFCFFFDVKYSSIVLLSHNFREAKYQALVSFKLALLAPCSLRSVLVTLFGVISKFQLMNICTFDQFQQKFSEISRHFLFKP